MPITDVGTAVEAVAATAPRKNESEYTLWAANAHESSPPEA